MAKGIFSKQQWSDAQAGFFNDCRTQTEIRTTLSERLWDNRVIIRFSFAPNDVVNLDGIESLERGKGDAGKCLDWFIALAQKHNLTITLKVYPFAKKDNDPLQDPDILELFYKRRGFQDDIYKQEIQRALILYPQNPKKSFKPLSMACEIL